MLRRRQPRSAASKIIWATRPKATVAGLMDRGCAPGCRTKKLWTREKAAPSVVSVRIQSPMKKCSYCGKEYPDDAVECPIDRNPLVALPPPSPPPTASERQHIIDSEHIKLLSIFHFVVAGLALGGIAFLFLHYAMMNHVFSNPDLWKSQKETMPSPREFMKVFVWFYIFMGIIFVAAFILNLLSGIFLHRRRHRIFSMVVGGLNCLQIPFGTLLGIFTIIVLSRDSIRATYANRPELKQM